jgi:2'-5' RNA ligase
METIVKTIPGYQENDYLIVLNPHDELSNRIKELREEFNKEFSAVITHGKPILPLVNYKQYEMMEERIINRLQAIAMGYPPFKVELKDFGSFPTHTIFIAITSKVPIQGLVKTIRTEAQRLMKFDDDNKPYFNLEPHISIARKLKPWQYEKAWLKYSNKTFTGRFIAKGITLLKRNGASEAWKLVKRFEFLNMPVTTKQGELFG